MVSCLEFTLLGDIDKNMTKIAKHTLASIVYTDVWVQFNEL
jgi:hypothetical protein